MALTPTFTPPEAARWRTPGGPWDVPDLATLLAAAAERAPDRAAVITGGGTRDTSDGNRDTSDSNRDTSDTSDGSDERLAGPALAERIARVAGGLAAAGAGSGTVVAWQRPNDAGAVLLYRACWHLGATALPLHPRAGAAEQAAILDGLDAHVVGDALPDGDPAPAAPVDPDSVAVALATGGTTGTPKLVLHTHRTLGHKALSMVAAHGLGPDDAVLMPAPLSHMSGLLNGVLVPGVAPFPVVLLARWDPATALDLVERHRVTFMVGPPTFFLGLAEAPGFTPGTSPLRVLSCGGATVTPAFVEWARATFAADVKRSYGSTEAPTVTTATPGDEPTAKATTDGRVTGAATVEIHDPATGAARPAGERGEVWVRGPEVCVGYADPAATAAAFTADGWYRTGDLGQLSPGGWLTIVGRLRDVIIRGGENIAAAEVEAALEAHPAVRQAVAVGVPDGRLGERVAAAVVTMAGESLDVAECRRWFEARGVARYKTPEEVYVLGELPLLPSGKPDRVAIGRLIGPLRKESPT